MVPEQTQGKKLDGLVGQPTLDPDVDLEEVGKELAAEMEAEWALVTADEKIRANYPRAVW